MDQRQVSPVSAEIQFGRHADALVGRAYAQPVANIVEIVGSREQAEEVGVLHLLDASQRGLIREERAALRLAHDQFVQAFGDFVRPAIGERFQAGEPLEVFFGQLEECEPSLSSSSSSFKISM